MDRIIALGKPGAEAALEEQKQKFLIGVKPLTKTDVKLKTAAKALNDAIEKTTDDFYNLKDLTAMRLISQARSMLEKVSLEYIDAFRICVNEPTSENFAEFKNSLQKNILRLEKITEILLKNGEAVAAENELESAINNTRYKELKEPAKAVLTEVKALREGPKEPQRMRDFAKYLRYVKSIVQEPTEDNIADIDPSSIGKTPRMNKIHAKFLANAEAVVAENDLERAINETTNPHLKEAANAVFTEAKACRKHVKKTKAIKAYTKDLQSVTTLVRNPKKMENIRACIRKGKATRLKLLGARMLALSGIALGIASGVVAVAAISLMVANPLLIPIAFPIVLYAGRGVRVGAALYTRGKKIVKDRMLEDKKLPKLGDKKLSQLMVALGSTSSSDSSDEEQAFESRYKHVFNDPEFIFDKNTSPSYGDQYKVRLETVVRVLFITCKGFDNSFKNIIGIKAWNDYGNILDDFCKRVDIYKKVFVKSSVPKIKHSWRKKDSILKLIEDIERNQRKLNSLPVKKSDSNSIKSIIDMITKIRERIALCRKLMPDLSKFDPKRNLNPQGAEGEPAFSLIECSM